MLVARTLATDALPRPPGRARRPAARADRARRGDRGRSRSRSRGSAVLRPVAGPTGGRADARGHPLDRGNAGGIRAPGNARHRWRARYWIARNTARQRVGVAARGGAPGGRSCPVTGAPAPRRRDRRPGHAAGPPGVGQLHRVVVSRLPGRAAAHGGLLVRARPAHGDRARRCPREPGGGVGVRYPHAARPAGRHRPGGSGPAHLVGVRAARPLLAGRPGHRPCRRVRRAGPPAVPGERPPGDPRYLPVPGNPATSAVAGAGTWCRPAARAGADR